MELVSLKSSMTKGTATIQKTFVIASLPVPEYWNIMIMLVWYCLFFFTPVTITQLRNEYEMHSIHIHDGQTYQITMQNPVWMQIVNAIKNLVQQRLHHVLGRADWLFVCFCRTMELYDMLHNSPKKSLHNESANQTKSINQPTNHLINSIYALDNKLHLYF